MTKILPPDVAWLVLARCADLVRREGAVLQSTEGRAVSGQVSGRVTLTMAFSDVEATKNVLNRDPADSFELAENLSLEWMRRADELRSGSRSEFHPAMAHACRTCQVTPDRWCIPIHAGERDAGGWVHPSRGGDVAEPRINFRTIGTAYSVVEYGNLVGFHADPEELSIAIVALARDLCIARGERIAGELARTIEAWRRRMGGFEIDSDGDIRPAVMDRGGFMGSLQRALGVDDDVAAAARAFATLDHMGSLRPDTEYQVELNGHLIVLPRLNDANGISLDVWGTLAFCPRNGRLDASYRDEIRRHIGTGGIEVGPQLRTRLHDLINAGLR